MMVVSLLNTMMHFFIATFDKLDRCFDRTVLTVVFSRILEQNVSPAAGQSVTTVHGYPDDALPGGQRAKFISVPVGN